MAGSVVLGMVEIWLPSVSERRCGILQDLSDPLGVETNAEALERVRTGWQAADRRGRLDLDCEADACAIYGGREAIIEVALLIHELAGRPLPADEVARARATLKAHRRPPRFRWEVGDVFAVPLRDGSFGFGQVICEETFAEGHEGRSPVCALFEHRAREPAADVDEILTSRTLALVRIVLTDPLDLQRWRVLARRPPIEDGARAPSVSHDLIEPLANAWHGLAPWNLYAHEDDLDRHLLPGVRRSPHALIRPKAESEDFFLWLNRQ